MQDFITGVQQIGIGVANASEAMQLYKKLFAMNVLIFDDLAEAALMTQYTGNEKHTRRAVLSLNMAGGGGFEIWQFKNRQPLEVKRPLQYGDLGINAARIKCKDVSTAHAELTNQPGLKIYGLQADPKDQPFFYVQDRYSNYFQIVNGHEWFMSKDTVAGGVIGAVIGVSNMENSINFYKEVLGIHELVYDITAVIPGIKGCVHQNYRKVLLRKKKGNKGAFHKLLGDVEIELVQSLDRQPQKLFDGRYWGDKGFIHLCLDVLNMDGLKAHASKKGFKFSVDSNSSFTMDAAAGRFCYVEDPDGSLIELVETHKVPIFKKVGFYFNLQKRGLQKPLPDWMIKILAINKVK